MNEIVAFICVHLRHLRIGTSRCLTSSVNIFSTDSEICMRYSRLTTFSILCLVLTLRIAHAELRIPYERYRLPNGLTVILHEDHSTPQVAVNLWYGVGSASERPGRTGFAHLFEHLMFMGSRDAPEGVFDQLTEAEGGFSN